MPTAIRLLNGNHWLDASTRIRAESTYLTAYAADFDLRRRNRSLSPAQVIAYEVQLASNPTLLEGHRLRLIRRSWKNSRVYTVWPVPESVTRPSHIRHVPNTLATRGHQLPLTSTITTSKASTEVDSPAHVARSRSGRFPALGPI